MENGGEWFLVGRMIEADEECENVNEISFFFFAERGGGWGEESEIRDSNKFFFLFLKREIGKDKQEVRDEGLVLRWTPRNFTKSKNTFEARRPNLRWWMLGENEKEYLVVFVPLQVADPRAARGDAGGAAAAGRRVELDR